MSLKVLLSEGSSLSSRHTLYGLGRKHTIDVMDPNPLCLSRFSRFVRRFIRCPFYARDPAGYLAFLADTLQRGRYDVLLPTHEQVLLLSRFRETLSRHVGVALPDFAAVERLQSKAEFVRLLEELDLPQPATQVVRTRQELADACRLPCYVKLPHSTAGQGVFLVRDEEQLRRLLDELAAQGRFRDDLETLVQQPARGTQATVQAVFRHGELVASHMIQARAVGVAGMASARDSVRHPEVVEHVRRLGAHLAWHGALFLDYFHSPDDGPQYLEANPRIGETVNATLCGVNLCEALVRVSLGQAVPPPPPAPLGLRSHSGFMILITVATEGGNRRQILAESWRQLTKRGLYENSQDELVRPRDDPWSCIPGAAITLQLLALPRLAQRIVDKTVRDYSLPERAMGDIRNLPPDTLAQAFARQ
jgi:predicted ATP-grasp superfamily ATP-dependent carboligase